ncbi:hypothetical protein KY290_027560 [Solanum tuberosum]|uniref:Uncharacterized protein n=1 Tax=Solanum tuberosum TaxID=4113 RepID=A0ABQ7UH73_SOLTU|nr:hypothetical protein KY285_026500 [Solanum tuberosum]KAH0748328.1 hypothetical protein KY290_027560 [Solanum tuberosum]
MYERLFEGDLPDGKSPESNILAAAEELVVIQSLASLSGDVQPTLLEQKLRSPEQVLHSVQPVFDQTPKSFDVDNEEEEEEETPLVWRRKGVRGANDVSVVIPDLEVVNNVHEANHVNEPTESEKKRKRKGKGKMVDSQTIGEGKRRYVNKNKSQKLMGDALATNEVQTERNQRFRRNGHMHVEEPT